MYSAVRRVVLQQLAVKEEGNPLSVPGATGGGGSGASSGVIGEALWESLGQKADTELLERVADSKANKVDTEMCLRWVDLLHKMINKMMILITCKLRSDIDLAGGESKNARQNRKVQLLNQSLIISKWVESFDSQNINDFYYQTEKEK